MTINRSKRHLILISLLLRQIYVTFNCAWQKSVTAG